MREFKVGDEKNVKYDFIQALKACKEGKLATLDNSRLDINMMTLLNKDNLSVSRGVSLDDMLRTDWEIKEK